MIRKILHTVATKFLGTLLGFAVLLITARVLGTDGRGEINLFVLNVSIVVMVSNLLGGPVLVYLVPRYRISSLMRYAYGWALAAAIFVVGVLHIIGQDQGMTMTLFAIALVEVIANASGMILLGQNEVVRFNWLMLLKSVILLSGVAFMLYGLQIHDITAFVIPFFLSGAAFVLPAHIFIYLNGQRGNVSNRSPFDDLRKLGVVNQLANFVQLFNYRLSYYLLELYFGVASVGVYGTGVTVAESLWLISRSVSQVQYAEISNSDDKDYAARLTLGLMKFNFFATVIPVAVVALLPESVFTWVFGSGFAEVKYVFLWLVPGILVFTVSGAMSHYFSGLGLHRINFYASSAGLIITVAAGLLFIPVYGMKGAAFTANLSYFTSTVYQLAVFVRKNRMSWRALLPGRNDVVFAKTQIDRIKALMGQGK